MRFFYFVVAAVLLQRNGASAADGDITQVAVSATPDCPPLFEPVAHDYMALQDHSVNPSNWLSFAIVSQQAYLCVSRDPSFGPPITDLVLTRNDSTEESDANGNIVPGNTNLNDRLFGTGIFLRTTTSSATTSEDKQPISNIRLVTTPPSEDRMPLRPDGLSGDLNQGSGLFGLFFGGMTVYLEILRDNDSQWVDANSLPTLVSYEFQEAGYPEPVYQNTRVCILWIFCIIQDIPPPCFHAQDVSSFADEAYVYTFYTMSDARYGQAYLVKTPLLDKNSGGMVSDEGAVVYYEEIAEFNHPSTQLVHNKIAMAAASNWDPTPTGSIKGIGCDLVNCGCEPDIAPENQDREEFGYVLWDFTKSTSSPARFVYARSEFRAIQEEEKPYEGGSPGRGLWGGTVDGRFVGRITSRWMTITDYDNLGNITNSWQEIVNVDFPVDCELEQDEAGRDLVELNGASYYAAFGFDCYTLRPATFDGTAFVVGACSTIIQKCPPRNSQLETTFEIRRSFQTATEGPDGRMHVTSLKLSGQETLIMSSDV